MLTFHRGEALLVPGGQALKFQVVPPERVRQDPDNGHGERLVSGVTLSSVTVLRGSRRPYCAVGGPDRERLSHGRLPVSRTMNRLADRTGWAHSFLHCHAKYGVIVFAVLLLAGWWLARSRADIDAVAAVVWAGAGAVVALGVGQLIGHAVDRARPYAVMPTAHAHQPHVGLLLPQRPCHRRRSGRRRPVAGEPSPQAPRRRAGRRHNCPASTSAPTIPATSPGVCFWVRPSSSRCAPPP